MAIYGAGSVWAEGEVMENFFAKNNFVLGWGYDDAEDLYGLISSVKVGDIIYLKSKSPKSPRMTVKAIGIVSKSLVHYLIANEKKGGGAIGRRRKSCNRRQVDSQNPV